MMLSNIRILYKTTAAVASLVVCAAMTGCLVEDTADGNGGGDITGDWTERSYFSSLDGYTQYYTGNDDGIQITTFRSSGEASVWGFGKVGDVWVEVPFDNGDMVRWRAEGGTIYISQPGRGETAWGAYEISDNQLIVTMKRIDRSCIDDDCDEVEYYVKITFERVNPAQIRSGISGPIYINNPGIRGEWELPSVRIDEDGNLQYDYEYLYLGVTGFDFYGTSDAGYRYLGQNDRSYGNYYTNGGNLYLVLNDCYRDDNDERHCTYAAPIVLPYRLSGSGDSRTLTIRNDVWTIRPRNGDSAPSSLDKRLSVLSGGEGPLRAPGAPQAPNGWRRP
jgi:hypothetical protein